MSVSEWSTTGSANTTVGAINIAENCPAGNMNDAQREVMAQIRAVLTDAALSILGKGSVTEIRDALDAIKKAPPLTALSDLTPAADRLPYFTSGSAASLATLTPFARSLLDDDDGATARGTLGAVGIGSAYLGDSYQNHTYDRPYSTFSRAIVSNAAEPGNPSGQQNGPGVAILY